MNETESTRQALLVVGMHRSGTSAVTRVLNLLGADLPKTLLPTQSDNPTGYWEADELPRLHDAFLASAGLSWDKTFPVPDGWLESEAARGLEENILAFLEKNFSDCRLFVVKDPRLTLFIPLWIKALRRFGAKPRFVIPHRPPGEVAASLRTRNGFALDKGRLLWLRYMLDAELFTRGCPRCFLTYSELLTNWRAAMAATAKTLGVTWPRSDARAEIDAFLDSGLRHHVASQSEIDDSATCGWGQTAYRWFCAASADPALDPAPLDAVRENLSLLEQMALAIVSLPLAREEVSRPEAAAEESPAPARAKEEEAARISTVPHELSRLEAKTGKLTNARDGAQKAEAALCKDAFKTEQQIALLKRDQSLLIARIITLERRSIGNRLLASSRLFRWTWRFCSLGMRALVLMREGRLWSKVREKCVLYRMSSRNLAGEGFYRSWNPEAPRGISTKKHCERTYLRPSLEQLSEPRLRARAERVAAGLLPDGQPETPYVSIIIPVYNNLHFTLTCLESLAHHQSRHSFEVLVVDDCSTDLTPSILPLIPGCRHLPAPANGGFIKACNYGLSQARGNYCVFLNNDTVALPDWLDELIDTFELHPDAGIVGSQLLYPDGILQEAGGLIWRDGSAWNYGRNDFRLRHEYSYLRDVSYVSGASLAIPRDLALELEGFDEHYCPAYGEDSDLAFRVREAGRRVLYQPFSRLIHFEGMTSGRDLTGGVKACQVVNAQKLIERWWKQMGEFPAPGSSTAVARDCLARRRALVIDACTPMPDQDSGSVTALGLMQGLQALDFKVCFAPQSNMAHIPGYTDALQRAGIEAIYNCERHAYPHVGDYIRSAGDIFDLVIIFRVGVASACIDDVHLNMPSAKVIFFTSDLHFLREARKAAMSGKASDKNRAEKTRREELLVAMKSDCCIVHSAVEQEILARELPNTPVELYGWSIDVAGRGEPFSKRRDFVFLGGYQHRPNVDAVLYFIQDIFPLIKVRIPDARFHVLGSHPPPELQRLASEDIIVTGYVPDLTPCLGSSRVGVAPLRYGAGIKGKIAMMMSHGLPVVTTAMGAEGMNLTHGKEALIQDDPRAFAEEAVRLHEDEVLWESLAAAGLDVVDQQYSRKASIRRIREILQTLHVIQPGPTR